MSGWGDALVQTRPANARAEVARSGWPATTTSSALTASPDFFAKGGGEKGSQSGRGRQRKPLRLAHATQSLGSRGDWQKATRGLTARPHTWFQSKSEERSRGLGRMVEWHERGSN